MSMTDCIEHLYSFNSTLDDALGCPGCYEKRRIVQLLQDRCLWLVTKDLLAEADELRIQIAIIKAVE